jgi:DNA-binding NarL/FixJ family response regulator
VTSQTGSSTHQTSPQTERQPEGQVRVAAWASDPITMNGLTQSLVGRLEVFVATGELSEEVDVVVFAVDRVDSEVAGVMRRVANRFAAPAVLVTRELDRSRLMSAVECRVVAVLHRRTATEERLIDAINLAATGAGVLPPNLLGELLRQMQNLQDEVLAPLGVNSAGLTSREIDVVRLLAEGLDTEEIGNRLSYSERTVKNIIYAMTSRLEVRNRPQLVAYALRAGVI